MVTSKLNVYCSLSLYLKNNYPEIAELSNILCLGHLFSTKPTMPQFTFLIPDGPLIKEITKKAFSNDVNDFEMAEMLVRSLHFYNNLSTLPSSSATVVNNLNKLVKIKSMKGETIEFENGGKAKRVSIKMPSRKAVNVSLYEYSGPSLMDPKAPDATREEINAAKFGDRKNQSAVKKKKGSGVRGGGEYLPNRSEFFNKIIEEQCNPNIIAQGRNPALEVLVELHNYLVENGSKDGDECMNNPKVIATLFSEDALASLAIVLQPCKNSASYISDDMWSRFSSDVRINQPTVSQYCYFPDPVARYVNIMTTANSSNSDFINEMERVKEAQLPSEVTKTGYIKSLAKFYEELASRPNNPRKQAPKLALAEAELRLMSAVQYDSNYGKRNVEETKALFNVKCTLNEPYMVANPDILRHMSNLTFYSYLMVLFKSNVVFFMPNLAGYNLSFDDAVGDVGNGKFKIEKVFDNLGNDGFYAEQNKYLASRLAPKLASA
jgi:hypothetical protein